MDKIAHIKDLLAKRGVVSQLEKLHEVVVRESVATSSIQYAHNQHWFLLNVGDLPAELRIESDTNFYEKEANAIGEVVEEFSGRIQIDIPTTNPGTSVVRLLFYQVVL